jgi:hypothetical protein
MRKLILIAAAVLVSVSAQAGPSRGPTIASNEPATIEQPTPTPPPGADVTPGAPERFVAQPSTPNAAIIPPPADVTKPVPETTAEAPKHKRETIKARLISELHRRGFHW